MPLTLGYTDEGLALTLASPARVLDMPPPQIALPESPPAIPIEVPIVAPTSIAPVEVPIVAPTSIAPVEVHVESLVASVAPPPEVVEEISAPTVTPTAEPVVAPAPREPRIRRTPPRRVRSESPAPLLLPAPGDVEVEFRDVSMNFGGIAALRALTTTIRAGELVFLIGSSGAGKTTMLRLINGQMRPSKGQVWVDDVAVHKSRGRRLAALRRRLGFIGEDCELLANRTSLENVEFALRVSDLRLPASEVRSRAMASLRNVGLAARASAVPAQLSTGQRQRIALARALVTRPVVLLADEPTAGLDNRNAMRVIKLLQRAAAHHTAVIVATHDGAIAASVRARILNLDKGRLAGDYPSWAELCRAD